MVDSRVWPRRTAALANGDGEDAAIPRVYVALDVWVEVEGIFQVNEVERY